MGETGEFRPERGVVVAYSSLSAFMVGLGVVFAAVTVQHGWHGALLIGIAFIPVSAWVLVRVFMVKVTFDADTLHIVGPFRSRRIRRADVVALDQSNLSEPLVEWTTDGSHHRESRLFAVSLPWGVSFTAAMSVRRRRFLVRLGRWMTGSHVPQRSP